MSNQPVTPTICPCCNGSGRDIWFSNEKCVTCLGDKHITTQILGDATKLEFGGETIPVDELESDLQLSKDLWEWVKHTHQDQNWWEVHAKIPVLETMEHILLQNNEINLSDITGGPNNPRHPEMLDLSRRVEAAIKKVAKDLEQQLKVADKMGQEYNSYQGKLKNAQARADEQLLHEKIKERAAAAAKLVLENNQTTNAESTKDVPMSNSTPIVNRLKGGGKTVLDAAKQGAKIGAINAINKGAVEMLEYKLGDRYPGFLKNEAGRKAMQLLIPALLLMACEMDEENKIPGKDYVRDAATLAVTGAGSEVVEEALSFLVSNGWMILDAYAQQGKEMASEGVPAIGMTAVSSDQEHELMRDALAKARAKVPEFAQ